MEPILIDIGMFDGRLNNLAAKLGLWSLLDVPFPNSLGLLVSFGIYRSPPEIIHIFLNHDVVFEYGLHIEYDLRWVNISRLMCLVWKYIWVPLDVSYSFSKLVVQSTFWYLLIVKEVHVLVEWFHGFSVIFG
jgi:hypothetical protein